MIYETRIHSSVIAMAGLALGVAATGAHAVMVGLNPTAMEISSLPKFCWAQMGVPNTEQQIQYKPVDCGPWTPHYCPGLVWLIRAKRQPNKAEAYKLLGRVQTDVRYTKNGIANYPRCSIRAHVEATEAEVERLRKAYEGTTKAPGPSR